MEIAFLQVEVNFIYSVYINQKNVLTELYQWGEKKA